jgi:type IV pilus assembly protein PilA
MKKQKTMGNKGFSLVELIVVIAIMAVLVGVLAPQFVKYVEKSRISTDIQNLDQIKSAVEVYLADTSVADGTVLEISSTEKDSSTDVKSDFEDAMTNAGLSKTVTFKSSKWSDVKIEVKDGQVKVTGTATYNKVDYNADGTNGTESQSGNNQQGGQEQSE